MAEESVGYIQAVAEDLKRVRGSLDKLETRIEELQRSVYSLQTGKIQGLEIELATLRSGTILNNENEIKKLKEGQTWLTRMIIGAFITGAIGIALTLIAKGF
jgi:predicted nuclease with TOPRIM domain